MLHIAALALASQPAGATGRRMCPVCHNRVTEWLEKSHARLLNCLKIMACGVSHCYSQGGGGGAWPPGRTFDLILKNSWVHQHWAGAREKSCDPPRLSNCQPPSPSQNYEQLSRCLLCDSWHLRLRPLISAPGYVVQCEMHNI